MKKIIPKRLNIYFSIAIIYYNKQDFLKYEEANNKVLSFEPKNQMALYNWGEIVDTQGINEMIKEFWNKVISISLKSETGKLSKESLDKLN